MAALSVHKVQGTLTRGHLLSVVMYQACHSSALCQRRGSPGRRGAVCPIVAGTGVRKRLPAPRGPCAWEGLSPWCGALCRAARRRAWTTASGTRAASRPVAPCSGVPRPRGGAPLSRATVARRPAHAPGPPRRLRGATPDHRRLGGSELRPGVALDLSARDTPPLPCLGAASHRRALVRRGEVPGCQGTRGAAPVVGLPHAWTVCPRLGGPPAPGNVSCRLSGRAKPGRSARGPRAHGPQRLASPRCAQVWSVAQAMRLLAWTQPRARGGRRGRQGVRRHRPLPPARRGCCDPWCQGGRGGTPPPHRARGPARVGPQAARGAGQRPYDGRSRRSVQRQTTRGAEPARGTAVPPWPSPVSRVRRSTPCPPRTAGRLLLCSSMPGRSL